MSSTKKSINLHHEVTPICQNSENLECDLLGSSHPLALNCVLHSIYACIESITLTFTVCVCVCVCEREREREESEKERVYICVY